MPCVGVTIPVGNIREEKLRDIIRDSEVIQDLRDYRHTIKGPCHTCEKADHCYGCRGAAYRLTGDYLASDPLCWKNLDRQGEIVCLPLAVADIIPQKPPMRVVDTLVKTGAPGPITIFASCPGAKLTRFDDFVEGRVGCQRRGNRSGDCSRTCSSNSRIMRRDA